MLNKSEVIVEQSKILKINNLYLSAIISIILIILLSVSSTHVYADNTTSPMTSSLNHTISLEKQASQYYLNDTRYALAINLAKNSTQFQFAVKGYNYTFNSINDVLSPSPQGGFELRGYDVIFDFYKGPIIPCTPGISVYVFEDPTLTRIFNITSMGSPGCFGILHRAVDLNHTAIPEFPVIMPILVISLASLLIFYRIKFKF